MKKGDIVTVNDYSWCTHINGYTRDCKKQYTVMEIGCAFPLQGDQHSCYRSDTVIKIIDGSEIVFIHANFLELVLPTHKVMVDMVLRPGYVGGEIIKISDKLYKEIKRGS